MAGYVHLWVVASLVPFLGGDGFGRRALLAAEVEHRPLYQMRHTSATLALAAGAGIYWVSTQLGHTNIQTTLKHYARFLPVVDERNLKPLDEFAA